MIDKLALEAERGLLLSHLLASGAGRAGVAGNATALPHLAPFVALQEKDMLSSIEIDRRKHNIDARFAESFESLLDKPPRSEEHTSELQSLMRISYAVFCLKKKTPQ